MSNSIGDVIKRLREQRDWSQRELARRVNINYSVLSRIESGKRPVEDSEIRLFADIFDVSADYLLGRTDDPLPIQKPSLDGMEMHDNESLFFFDLEGLSEEDIEKVKEHIEFLRYQAKKHHEKEQQQKKQK